MNINQYSLFSFVNAIGKLIFDIVKKCWLNFKSSIMKKHTKVLFKNSEPKLFIVQNPCFQLGSYSSRPWGEKDD